MTLRGHGARLYSHQWNLTPQYMYLTRYPYPLFVAPGETPSVKQIKSCETETEHTRTDSSDRGELL